MQARGAMLRLARHRKALQQNEAAPLLGTNQPTLSRIENGVVEARPELIAMAERAYSLPRSFFSLPDPVLGPPVSVHAMWRKKASVTTKELDAVVAELNVRAIHLRRLLEGVEVVHSTDLPRLDIDDYESPEAVATIVRAHWKIPPGPIESVTSIAEKAGILVAHSRLREASISGVTFAAPGLPPLIVLNSSMPADRMRFTLCHELGHLVMHRFPSPAMEKEANEFAAAFLMPASEIRQSFKGRRIDLALLASMKPEWKVAMQSLLMRASSLGFLSSNQSRYLWQQINARRLRLREPPELDFPHEEPAILPGMLTLHEKGLGYSTADLARILHIYESDLRDMYPLGDETPEPRRPKLTIMR